jgi:pimeloyl-ACP methyl ester carboxylesterase
MLAGFGLDDLGPLAAARYVDWCRDALNAYDLLAQTAEAVSIVGLSYGAVLASFIAERRPVRHLVLVSPYFFAQRADSLPARLTVVDSWWGRALRWFVGVVAKPILPGRVGQPDIVDGSRFDQVLNDGTLPVGSVHPLWQTAHPVPLDRLQAKTITVALGLQELTVDLPRLEAWLATQAQPIQRLVYPNAGHVLFEDQAGAAAAADLVSVLVTVPV